jgi:hypothetical protein
MENQDDDSVLNEAQFIWLCLVMDKKSAEAKECGGRQ